MCGNGTGEPKKLMASTCVPASSISMLYFISGSKAQTPKGLDSTSSPEKVKSPVYCGASLISILKVSTSIPNKSAGTPSNENA